VTLTLYVMCDFLRVVNTLFERKMSAWLHCVSKYSWLHCVSKILYYKINRLDNQYEPHKSTSYHF
jgi:hypothetical protein